MRRSYPCRVILLPYFNEIRKNEIHGDFESEGGDGDAKLILVISVSSNK